MKWSVGTPAGGPGGQGRVCTCGWVWPGAWSVPGDRMAAELSGLVFSCRHWFWFDSSAFPCRVCSWDQVRGASPGSLYISFSYPSAKLLSTKTTGIIISFFELKTNISAIVCCSLESLSMLCLHQKTHLRKNKKIEECHNDCPWQGSPLIST